MWVKELILPSTVTTAEVVTSPILAIYSADSASVTFVNVKECKTPSSTALDVSLGTIFFLFFNHVTFSLGLLVSHVRVTDWPSWTVAFVRGSVNATGDSGIKTSENYNNQRRISTIAGSN